MTSCILMILLKKLLDLLDITICHSLSFNIEENISSVLNVIPNNAFGVFVTVHRTDLPNNKDYNINVHGCIGKWTNNINDINQNIARFDVMNKNNIIESIKMVSYKATWEDNRKNYFDTIYKDSYSDYEITFLLNNIYSTHFILKSSSDNTEFLLSCDLLNSTGLSQSS